MSVAFDPASRNFDLDQAKAHALLYAHTGQSIPATFLQFGPLPLQSARMNDIIRHDHAAPGPHPSRPPKGPGPHPYGSRT